MLSKFRSFSLLTLVCTAFLVVNGCAVFDDANLSDRAETGDVDVPEVLASQYRAALSHMKAKQYPIAIDRFLVIDKQYPDFSGASLNIAIAYLRLKKYDEALSFADKAIKINQNNFKAHNVRGNVLRHQGQFELAKLAYNKALTINPQYQNAHLNIGILFDLYLHQPTRALKHYKRYQSLAGEDRKIKGWIVEVERRIKNR